MVPSCFIIKDVEYFRTLLIQSPFFCKIMGVSENIHPFGVQSPFKPWDMMLKKRLKAKNQNHLEATVSGVFKTQFSLFQILLHFSDRQILKYALPVSFDNELGQRKCLPFATQTHTQMHTSCIDQSSCRNLMVYSLMVIEDCLIKGSYIASG